MTKRRVGLGLLLCGLAAPLLAHEVRPAYLELRESANGDLDVLWKTPMVGDLRLSLAPVLSGPSEELAPLATRRTGAAAVQTWKLRLLEPLRGRELGIEGLAATMTDALVRVEFARRLDLGRALDSEGAGGDDPGALGGWSVAGTYLVLGVEHILTGIDHLLFVLALLIITGGGWKMVKTVTAFTVSHSVTLTAATLGLVHVPQQPVEAIIALSIVFVAAEILRGRQGRPLGIAARAPWVVAFSFGLLHGLGFAGGLSEAGLPEGHIPLALLFFSLGVEAGHFLFVAFVLASMALARRVLARAPQWIELVPPYAIGSVAMFWVIQRVAQF